MLVLLAALRLCWLTGCCLTGWRARGGWLRLFYISFLATPIASPYSPCLHILGRKGFAGARGPEFPFLLLAVLLLLLMRPLGGAGAATGAATGTAAAAAAAFSLRHAWPDDDDDAHAVAAGAGDGGAIAAC